MLTEMIRRLISEEIDDFAFNVALNEIDQIVQAKDFMRQTHAGQWRKGTPIPYSAHPMRVYHRAKKRGLSKKHQILAILHDTFEDSKNPQRTLKKIKEMFGNNIAKLVLVLSHDKSVNYNGHILALAKKSPTALDIKLLDMEDNLSDKPNPKQLSKYKSGIQYLLSNGVMINPKIEKRLLKLVGA